MHSFRYVGNKLHCEGVSIESLVKQHGTPLYVYSQTTLEDHFQKLDRAMAPVDHQICFAVKSNSNLAVLRTLAGLGSVEAVLQKLKDKFQVRVYRMTDHLTRVEGVGELGAQAPVTHIGPSLKQVVADAASLPGWDTASWFAIFVKTGTDRNIITALHRDRAKRRIRRHLMRIARQRSLVKWHGLVVLIRALVQLGAINQHLGVVNQRRGRRGGVIAQRALCQCQEHLALPDDGGKIHQSPL